MNPAKPIVRRARYVVGEFIAEPSHKGELSTVYVMSVHDVHFTSDHVFVSFIKLSFHSTHCSAYRIMVLSCTALRDNEHGIFNEI